MHIASVCRSFALFAATFLAVDGSPLVSSTWLLHFDRVTTPGQRPWTSNTIKPRASHARNDVKLYPCFSSLICDILAPGWGALERFGAWCHPQWI